MSDMTQKQILEEFKRQVRLCSGIGKLAMLDAVTEHFDGKREHIWQFYMNGTFCRRCGCGIGDRVECRL